MEVKKKGATKREQHEGGKNKGEKGGNNKGGKGSLNGGKSVVCYGCGELGHVAAACPKKKNTKHSSAGEPPAKKIRKK